MTYRFIPSSRVCSREMIFNIDENNRIESMEVIGGCHGNLQGIGRLLVGMDVEEVISRLEGIDCHGRGTSCPDQISIGLKEYLKEN